MRTAISPTFRQQATRRRGAAAVELAVVLPLFLLLLLGGTDFGRFAYTWIAVTNAARAGAGYGSTTPFTASSRPAWEAGIRRAVRNDLEQTAGFDASVLKSTIASAVDAEGRKRVAVTVEYEFEPLISWEMLPGSVSLKQTAVFPVIR